MSEEAIMLMITLFCMCGTAIILVWLVCRSDDKTIATLKDIVENLEKSANAQEKFLDKDKP